MTQDRHRPRVDLAANRCPFCHDGVEASAGDWVACARCLARHHAGCWSEGGVCGACGGGERLVPAPAEGPQVRPGPGPLARWGVRNRASYGVSLLGGGLWLALCAFCALGFKRDLELGRPLGPDLVVFALASLILLPALVSLLSYAWSGVNPSLNPPPPREKDPSER